MAGIDRARAPRVRANLTPPSVFARALGLGEPARPARKVSENQNTPYIFVYNDAWGGLEVLTNLSRTIGE